jgi:thioredoxin-related protein
MKIKLLPIMAVLTSMLLAACQTARSPTTSGEWTDDFQAAKEVARQTRLPILLNFSCGPSIAMDEEVFSKPKWKTYARKHLVMVAVNISYEEMEDMRKADPTKDAIRIQYNITGYPTFVLLDDDGETVLGLLGGRRLSALGEPSPKTFRQLFRPYLHYGSVEVERTSSSMKEKDRERYRELAKTRNELMHEIQNIFSEVAQATRMRWYAMAEIKELNAELKSLHPEEGEYDRHKELSARIEQLNDEKERARALEREKDMPLWSKSIVRNFVKAEEEMRDIRVAQLSEAEQSEYKELVEEVDYADRHERNIEDKMEYYRLEHQKLVY